MTLDQYLTEHRLTETEFGKRVPLSQSQVNRIRRGAKPSSKTISRIFRATDGEVTANDFFEGKG